MIFLMLQIQRSPIGLVFMLIGGSVFLDLTNMSVITENLLIAGLTDFLSELHATLLLGSTGQSFVLLIPVFAGTLMLAEKIERVLFAEESITLELNKLPMPISPSRPLLTPSGRLKIAISQAPESTPSYIRFPSAEYSDARIRLRLKDKWHLNQKTLVTIDGLTGGVIEINRADEGTILRRALNAMYPIHSGHSMASYYKLIILIAGLGLMRLLYSGLLSWWLQKIEAEAVAPELKPIY